MKKIGAVTIVLIMVVGGLTAANGEQVPSTNTTATIDALKGEIGGLAKQIKDEELKTAEAVNARETTAGLAYATGVVYICLWIIHGLVLVLPTNGLGRELPLAHFKRGAAERKVQSLREKEGRLLRDILTNVLDAKGEDHEILFRETIPVIERVNKAAGWVALKPRYDSDANPQNAARQGQSPISLTPKEGPAGTRGTAKGTDWPAGAEVHAFFDQKEVAVVGVVDPNGSFTLEFCVPNLPPGDYPTFFTISGIPGMYSGPIFTITSGPNDGAAGKVATNTLNTRTDVLDENVDTDASEDPYKGIFG